MEQHRKRYIKPGDLLFANRDNSDGSTPPNDAMKDDNTSDATQDNINDTSAAKHTKKVSPTVDPRLSPPLYARPLLSRTSNEKATIPGASQSSLVHADIPDGATNTVSSPTDASDGTRIFETPTTSLTNMLKDPHALGIMLASTYHTTTSDEIKNIIGCLVHLDVMITRQTHLNELHEAHTAKNFREQRHLNKDRKLHLGTTVKQIEHKFAGLDAQRMAQQTTIKQHDIRANSQQLQLKGLNEKTQMLAQAGEWMETTVGETQQELTDLRSEVEGLELANMSLTDEVRGLKEGVRRFKEKEEVWETRLSALEQVADRKVQLAGVRVKQQQVLNAASFAVGNGRVFPFSR